MSVSLKHINHIYFIGIGGIGMSALARWFNANGKKVLGYDKTATHLTDLLEKEGMSIHFEDSVSLIPMELIKEIDKTLVIYTPAIPKGHREMDFFLEKGFTLMKRSEVLGLITQDYFTIAVAGTHGKTTTSSMIAHLLKASGRNCTAFLGGITANYNSNLLLSEEQNENTIIVVEADEYDRSFLRLSPNVAVITSVEADHLDIYGDENSVTSSFNSFAGKLEKEGTLFYRKGIDLTLPFGIENKVYGLEEGEFKIENISITGDAFHFDVAYEEHQKIENLKLQMPGYHNVENATAAVAVALEMGLNHTEIKEALASYKGVKRRFEYIHKSNEVVYIDDYAHHPTEVEAFIKSLRGLYPEKEITVIFQPHLFSRTRDFAEGFAKSLSLADSLLLMDIYPARELPIDGVTSDIILDKVTLSQREIVSDNHLLDSLRGRKIEILATVGAGNIDRFVEPIKQILVENNKV